MGYFVQKFDFANAVCGFGWSIYEVFCSLGMCGVVNCGKHVDTA